MFDNPAEKLKSYGNLAFVGGVVLAVLCLAFAALNPSLSIICIGVAAPTLLSSYLFSLVLNALGDMLISMKAIQKDASEICGMQKALLKTQKGMFQYQLKSDKEF